MMADGAVQTEEEVTKEDGLKDEEEKHIEITIGEPVAEKVIDSCVGTDNRRYYKVCWQATWEPEEDLLIKNHHLVSEYWKHTIASHDNDSEQRALINDLLQNIMQQQQQQQQEQQQQQHFTESSELQNGEDVEKEKENAKVLTSFVGDTSDGDLLYFYKEVNSPEHKISDQPVSIVGDNGKKPPPLLTKKNDEPLPYKCEECDRSYATQRKLKDHCRKLHTNQGIYQCSECPKQFSNKRALQMHMNRHTGIGPHQCPGCKKRYMTPQELEFHKKSCNALVEKDYECNQCAKRFATKTHLVFHMKIHLPDEEKPFKCQYCPRTFAYNHDCVHHMRLHVGEKPFCCNECDAAFHRKSYLTEHMFVHTGISKYRCEECQEYFKTQQMLQTHVKNIHILKKEPKPPGETKKSKKTPKKKYKCEDCDKEFRYVKEFHVHQMVNHKEKFEQQTDKELLSNFEPTVYYKCKKCDKTFRWLSVLKRHTETHQKMDEQPVTDKQLKGDNAEEEEEEGETDVIMQGDENEATVVEIRAKNENESEAMESIENEGNAIRVYVAQGGQITTENGEEVNILACGHCMAGFTDESDLNEHVITEHADLIAQAEVTTVQIIQGNENENIVVDDQVDVKVEVVAEEDMVLAEVVQQSDDYT